MMCGYFEVKERLFYQGICQTFKTCMMNPFLWKELSINNNQMIFSQLPSTQKYCNMLTSFSKLQIISLKYCPLFNSDTLSKLNTHCNPFTLSELYLDGCE